MVKHSIIIDKNELREVIADNIFYISQVLAEKVSKYENIFDEDDNFDFVELIENILLLKKKEYFIELGRAIEIADQIVFFKIYINETAYNFLHSFINFGLKQIND